MAGIFISYRRDDVAGQVGRLYGRLVAHYGEDFVFMDVESINPSQQFESVIQKRITECDVMLLAIGPHWQAERTGAKDSKDFVRMELVAALSASRPLCPMLIDRREPLEAAALPVEFQQVLGSHAIEIRHSTFDTDVEALIKGLEKQGIRPPPSFGRQRVEDALAAAGWPYSWFGALSRALSPLGVAALVMVFPAIAVWLAYQVAYGRGVTAGDALGRAASALIYEERIGQQNRASLLITGLVTDGSQGVEEAKVTLTNTSNGLTVSESTDSRGVYNINLEKINVAEDDVVRFVVTKPPFRPTIENIRYHDGFREFRAVLRR